MSTKKTNEVKANINDEKREIKTKDFLSYKFTEEELKEFADDMARGYQELDGLEKEKTSVVSNFKAKIDGKKAELGALATKINNRQEHRYIECVLRMNDPKVAHKTLVRLDTSEIVWVKPMTNEEMQLKLNLENEENIGDAAVSHSEYNDNHK